MSDDLMPFHTTIEHDSYRMLLCLWKEIHKIIRSDYQSQRVEHNASLPFFGLRR